MGRGEEGGGGGRIVVEMADVEGDKSMAAKCGLDRMTDNGRERMEEKERERKLMGRERGDDMETKRKKTRKIKK